MSQSAQSPPLHPVTREPLRSGEFIVLDRLPPCDFCGYREARYDAKTESGPWAYMCQEDYEAYGVDGLGIGVGQYLVTSEETEGGD